jgi:hypothetical protein
MIAPSFRHPSAIDLARHRLHTLTSLRIGGYQHHASVALGVGDKRLPNRGGYVGRTRQRFTPRAIQASLDDSKWPGWVGEGDRAQWKNGAKLEERRAALATVAGGGGGRSGKEGTRAEELGGDVVPHM